MFFRSTTQRRCLIGAVSVMALLAGGCKGMRDKLNKKLYTDESAASWPRDSALISSSPPVLFRVMRKGEQQYILPVALLSKSAPLTLRLNTKRGWSLFDINLLYEGREVTPVRDGFGLLPVKMLRGMWEIPSAPLDTIPGCSGTVLPMGLVSVPASTELVVANYKLPTGMKSLSAGEMETAISMVPLLVAPTLQVSGEQLSSYTRSIHEIPRVGADPAIFLEYHDERPLTDTSVVGMRRPRHVLIVLEKGVYGYRPSWTYKTTGGPNDRSVLRFVGVMDADMDGRAEIFLKYEPVKGISFILAFHEWNDSWQEYWRRSPARCEA